jgi:hypothetical protein
MLTSVFHAGDRPEYKNSKVILPLQGRVGCDWLLVFLANLVGMRYVLVIKREMNLKEEIKRR